MKKGIDDMKLNRIIEDLKGDRNDLARAIRALEEFLGMHRTGRGGFPYGDGDSPGSGPGIAKVKSNRGRKFMDAQGRMEVSERMKRYWAERRREREDARSEAPNSRTFSAVA